jgi:hypothetical protein
MSKPAARNGSLVSRVRARYDGQSVRLGIESLLGAHDHNLTSGPYNYGPICSWATSLAIRRIRPLSLLFLSVRVFVLRTNLKLNVGL